MPRVSKLKKLKTELARKRGAASRLNLNKVPCELDLRVRKRTNLTIWLDVDGTLLYSKRRTGIYVTARPYLSRFIKFCSAIAKKVGIITADTALRTQEKLKEIGFPTGFEFITAEKLLKRSIRYTDGDSNEFFSATDNALDWIKLVPDFDVNNTLIIDDISEFYLCCQRDNVLEMKRFSGKKDDHSLLKACTVIQNIVKDRERTISGHICEAERKLSTYFTTKSIRPYPLTMNFVADEDAD